MSAPIIPPSKLLLVAALTVWSTVVHADPKIIRVGEDAPDRVRSIQSMMKRYHFNPVGPTRAADFYLPDVAGGTTGLTAFRNDWVILVFFATWCGPCAREMPSLNEFSRAAAGTAHVVAVASDSPDQDIAPYVQRFGLSFNVLYDTGRRAARSYNVTAFPTIFILEPGGKIVGTLRGGADWNRIMPMIRDMQRLGAS